MGEDFNSHRNGKRKFYIINIFFYFLIYYYFKWVMIKNVTELKIIFIGIVILIDIIKVFCVSNYLLF